MAAGLLEQVAEVQPISTADYPTPSSAAQLFFIGFHCHACPARLAAATLAQCIAGGHG